MTSALATLHDANLVLISVPGEFAAAEARRALDAGLHVMVFSDNVPLAEEVSLKRAAVAKGLLLMGPDCGTCLIGGVPVAFANVVPRGGIGIVSASGTGLQEVSSLLARAGCGVSHGIGVGGRDLKNEVGGLMTLAAIDALERDPATRHIVIISKPPSPAVSGKIVARVAKSGKPFTLCLLGARRLELPRNARLVQTLQAAAEQAGGFRVPRPRHLPVAARRGWIRGLYSGGTLCAEAQLVLLGEGLSVRSNVPVPGAGKMRDALCAAHTLIDLGDDAYTRGRPHPMIDPELRNTYLTDALRDARTAVVLIDLVIGYGAHADPAGLIAQSVASVKIRRATVIASVTGTNDDPQGYARQVARLQAAGVFVARSNSQAALLAAHAVAGSRGAAAPGSRVPDSGVSMKRRRPAIRPKK
jgi:FdrA protein